MATTQHKSRQGCKRSASRSTAPPSIGALKATKPSPISTAPPKDTTFNFQGLPREIRFKIMHLTYTRQAIVLDCDNWFRSLLHRNPHIHRITPTPVALRVNHEWQQEALKHYQVLRYKPTLWEKQYLPTIYLSFAIDTLQFMCLRDPSMRILSFDETMWKVLDEIDPVHRRELAVLVGGFSRDGLHSTCLFAFGPHVGLCISEVSSRVKSISYLMSEEVARDEEVTREEIDKWLDFSHSYNGHESMRGSKFEILQTGLTEDGVGVVFVPVERVSSAGQDAQGETPTAV